MTTLPATRPDAMDRQDPRSETNQALRDVARLSLLGATLSIPIIAIICGILYCGSLWSWF